ncbi:alpha/beta fold hydrolase [Streptodolium elevatio]
MMLSSELKWFTSDDGELAYRDEGAGHPVVLLHAGYLTHEMWDAQVPALAADHRVIAPDARGHGDSANASKPFRQTDDLAALLRHLDIGPAVLVGISMGAGIAVDTALEHPELAAGVVISGAGTSEPEYSDPWTLQIFTDQATAMATGDVEGWLSAALRSALGPTREFADMDAELMCRIREMTVRTVSKHTMDEENVTVPVTDTWSRASRITVPILAIHGALDSPDLIGMAERLVDNAPHGRSATIDGVAHYPNMERPDEFNALVREFLRDVYGAAPLTS